MSRYRRQRIRKELIKSSSSIRKMYKLSIIIFLSLLVLGAITGGILWSVFNEWSWFVISIGVSLGAFGFCMICFVFWFLFSISSGKIDIKEPKDEEVILSETRLNLDMISEANKMAEENKAKGKSKKLYLVLIYGWLFICIIGIIVGSALDNAFRPEEVPLYGLIGIGCFVLTLFGLIIFGAVIPNARIKIGSRKAAKSNFSREVNAVIKKINFRSGSSNNTGRVKETFRITFKTLYGDSKCLYSIKNWGRGDTKADGKRFCVGDEVLILINPNDPKYCAIIDNNIMTRQ